MHGKTQKSAAYRVDLKRGLRKAKVPFESGQSTKELERMFRQTVGTLPKKKTPDELRKMSRW